GHLELFREVHAGARALLAVSQGGVEDDQTVVGHGDTPRYARSGVSSPVAPGRWGNKKALEPRRSQGRNQQVSNSSGPRQPGPIPPVGGAKGPEAGSPQGTASFARHFPETGDGPRVPSTIALL